METSVGLPFHVFCWSQINHVVLRMNKDQCIRTNVPFTTQHAGEVEGWALSYDSSKLWFRGSCVAHLLGTWHPPLKFEICAKESTIARMVVYYASVNWGCVIDFQKLHTKLRHINLPIRLLLLPSRAGSIKNGLWVRVLRMEAEVRAWKGMDKHG